MEKTLVVLITDDGQVEVIKASPINHVHNTEFVAPEQQSDFQNVMGCKTCTQVVPTKEQVHFCCLRCYVFFYHNQKNLLNLESNTCHASS
jgi:uncharacterized paraquat-inducible protein A